MLSPRYLTDSVRGSKRCPWQVGQAWTTSGRKLISCVMTPMPLQVSQRPPPFELKEKRAGAKPCTMASAVAAYSLRIGSQMPRNVAGTERGVRPIGLWSTLTARMMPS